MHQIRDARSKHTHTHKKVGNATGTKTSCAHYMNACGCRPGGLAGVRQRASGHTQFHRWRARCALYMYIYIYIWLCNSNYLFKLFLRCILNEGIVPSTCGGRENASVCAVRTAFLCCGTAYLFGIIHALCASVRACALCE